MRNSLWSDALRAACGGVRHDADFVDRAMRIAHAMYAIIDKEHVSVAAAAQRVTGIRFSNHYEAYHRVGRLICEKYMALSKNNPQSELSV